MFELQLPNVIWPPALTRSVPRVPFSVHANLSNVCKTSDDMHQRWYMWLEWNVVRKKRDAKRVSHRCFERCFSYFLLSSYKFSIVCCAILSRYFPTFKRFVSSALLTSDWKLRSASSDVASIMCNWQKQLSRDLWKDVLHKPLINQQVPLIMLWILPYYRCKDTPISLETSRPRSQSSIKIL